MYEKPQGSGWLVLLGILGLTAGSCWFWFQVPQLQARLSTIDPEAAWVIEQGNSSVTARQAWSIVGLPLLVVSLGLVLLGSQPASAIRWWYLLNPVGFGLITLVGYPFRHAGKHFRGFGLMMLAIGIGFLAYGYSIALPDGKQLTDNELHLFSALPLVTLGGALSIGGLLRFVCSPFRAANRNHVVRRRPKISREVLCGN